jgi:hypothetical protein
MLLVVLVDHVTERVRAAGWGIASDNCGRGLDRDPGVVDGYVATNDSGFGDIARNDDENDNQLDLLITFLLVQAGKS